MNFWTGAGSGLVSGVGSLLSGLYNTFIGQKQSKDLMDYQYKLQQDAIDKQNFYNSPAEQMKRLQAAGLSPNLVYGSGVDGNQSSAASPSLASKHGQMGNPLQDAVEAYQQSRMTSSAIAKNEQDIKESEARIALNNAKTLGIISDNTWKDQTLGYRVDSAKQSLANDIAKEYKTYADIRLTENKLDELWANIDLIKSRKHLTDQQAITELVRQESLRSGIRVNEATIQKIAAEIPYIKAGTDLREQAANIQDVEFDAGKAGDQWLAEHPKVAVVYNLLCKLLGVGKDIANIVTP